MHVLYNEWSLANIFGQAGAAEQMRKIWQPNEDHRYLIKKIHN